MESEKIAYYKTPIGTARIIGNNDGIISVVVIEDKIETSTKISKCLESCIAQLEEYFEGNRTLFNLKINHKNL